MDYIIGDVQGCYDTLQILLKKINFSEDRDRLFFLGDVVNRGNKSLETLRFIYSLKENANMVLGNHDFHLLVCALTSQQPNLKDTFTDILNSPDRHTLIEYLLSRPLILELQDALLVHAGIPPQWSTSDALHNAKLVHQKLQGNDSGQFLTKMFGIIDSSLNTWYKPSYWSDELNEEGKCRYTINALMRMRFCKENGELEFKHKMHVNQPPEGFKAWFFHPNRALKDKDIFFGHWPTLKDIDVKHVYAMDHGCFYREHLSAFRLFDRTLFSQNSIEGN